MSRDQRPSLLVRATATIGVFLPVVIAGCDPVSSQDVSPAQASASADATPTGTPQAGAAPAAAGAAANCGRLFDDFNYSSHSDPALSDNGWTIRDNAGGPGLSGASWRRDNIAFPTEDGQKSLQLQMTTDGTVAGTTQAEISLADRRFFEGTYAARIKFWDTPVSGPDGDHLNQTFYSISPLAHDGDPDYSELDYAEYLPNGGWGATTHTNFQTSWYSYSNDPEWDDSVSNNENVSLAGWHDIMATVSGGHVRYYVDGALVADHSGKYYPRQNMSIDFNEWIIDLKGHQGTGISVWHEQVDYVYHNKKSVLTRAEVNSEVADFRAAGITHSDSVVADNDCTS